MVGHSPVSRVHAHVRTAAMESVGVRNVAKISHPKYRDTEQRSGTHALLLLCFLTRTNASGVYLLSLSRVVGNRQLCL